MNEHEPSSPPNPRDKARQIILGVPEHHGVMGFFRAYAIAVQRYFTTGLLVWVPLIVTLWICWWVVVTLGGNIEATIRWIIEHLVTLGARYQSLRFLTVVEYQPGYGLLIALIVFLLTGIFARYLIMRRIIALGEKLLDRIPLVSRIYRAVQQIRDTFTSRETVFEGVAAVEYPRSGVYSIAFITQREASKIESALGRKMTAVFMPTTPNPTTGFLMYFPAEEVVLLDISVEEAFKLIMSMGAMSAMPPDETGQPMPGTVRQLEQPPPHP